MAVKRLLLLSGAIGSGKSSIAKVMEEVHQFSAISSSGYLRVYGVKKNEAHLRHELQDLGDRLDKETDFAWIVNDVAAPTIAASPCTKNWLLDAVRKPRQVEHFRFRFGNLIQHVHLTAPEDVLQSRYSSRVALGDPSYAMAARHPNEIAARSLGLSADHVFDTNSASVIDIATQILREGIYAQTTDCSYQRKDL